MNTIRPVFTRLGATRPARWLAPIAMLAWLVVPATAGASGAPSQQSVPLHLIDLPEGFVIDVDSRHNEVQRLKADLERHGFTVILDEGDGETEFMARA